MMKYKLKKTERLTELMRQQKWNHLTREQKAELKAAILDNHELFILDKSKLGLMKGSPAKIKVADPQPSRGPRYRYPEEAKKIDSENDTRHEGQANHKEIIICMVFTHSFGQ